MRACHLAILSLLTPTIVSAQQAVSDSMPHAGTWGAEINVGSGPTGANVLRFLSRNSALVVGGEFSYTHIDRHDDGPGDAFGNSQTTFAGRLGIRAYRASSTERLRPVIGFGVRSGSQKAGSFKNWDAGAYGELGAAYFVTPHVSLGGTGEIQASYAKTRQGSSSTDKRTNVVGSLMRVVLAAYF